MAKKIFVSYRRGGVKARTYRMVDALKRRFGEDSIFLDIDSIEPGAKFADVIRDSINSSSVVLIMIGPKWLNMKRGGNRRLDDSGDHLRIEVETALRSTALVIPILVDGATMPLASELPDQIAGLAALNAYPLSDSHWSYDIQQLIDKIGTDTEKLSIPAIVSLVLSVYVLAFFVEGDYGREDMLETTLASAVAFFLSAHAFRKTRPTTTRNRAICITGMVLGGLFALVSLSEYEDLQEYEDPQEYEDFQDYYGRNSPDGDSERHSSVCNNTVSIAGATSARS